MDGIRTLRDRPTRPGIRTSLISGTVAFALTRGIPMARITERTGLRPADLLDHDGWLPELLMPAVWRLVAEACPGRPLGLEAAELAPLDVFGPVTYVARHAATRRDGLLAFVRYRFALSDNLRMKIVEDAEETRLEIFHPMDDEDQGLAAEMGMGVGMRLGRTLGAGPDTLVRIELRHAPFGPTRDYEAFFGVPVRFGRPTNAMVYRTQMLALPGRVPDAQLSRYLRRHLDESLRARTDPGESDEVARIRAVIADNARRSEYGAEALAKALGMSLRTLQRVAKSSGLGIRELIEQTRATHAKALLADSRLSVEQVAYLLGYSEDRAFRRAFKRWAEVTPAQYRRQALGRS